MTNPEPSAAPWYAGRRTKVLAGVGLAAVLGGGALLLTQPGGSDTRETGALAPIVPSASPASPASPASADPASSGAAAPAASTATSSSAPPAAAGKPAPRTKEEAVQQLRGSAAKASTVQRALPPVAAAAAIPDDQVRVTETGSLSDERGKLKVVSARGDLSGQRELIWITGIEGQKVGDARCSQSIRLSPDAPPRQRPTFLMCWRTSAEKSVYTVAVNLKNRPSAAASVAALDKAWTALS